MSSEITIPNRYEKALPLALGVIVSFAALAHGAHDLWAAGLVYLAALACAVWTVVRGASEEGPGVFTAFLIPLFILIGVFACSFSRAVNPEESVLALADWTAAGLLFWVGLHAFRTEGGARLFSAVIVPSVWAQFLIDVSQKLSTGSLLTLSEPTGSLVNANLEAAYLILWIPVFYHLMRRKQGSLEAFYWGSGFLAAVGGLLLVSSTWAVICLLVAIPWWNGPAVLLRWVRERRTSAIWIGLAMTVLAGGLIWYKFHEVFAHWSPPLPPRESTTRLDWWRSGLLMFRDFPWLGVGIGNYPSAYLAYKVGAGQHTLYAHSLPVSLLAETGLFGIAAAGFFGVMWSWCVRSHWNDCEDRWPFALGAILFFLFSVISVSFEYLSNLAAAFLLLSLVVSPAVCQPRRLRRSIVFIVSAVAVAALPFLASLFMASERVVSGQESLKGEKLPEAIAHFSSAAELDGLNWEAERGWAAALFQEFQKSRESQTLEAAVAHQRKAVRLNRLQGALWWELGVYLQAKGGSWLVEAASCYQKASECHRSDPRYLKAYEDLKAQLPEKRL